MKSTPVQRAPLFLLLFLIIGMIASPTLWADTTVGGTISTDTTWTVADSPYIVTSNITVKGTDGADGITTLTIEPGVVVKLNNYRYIDIGASSGDPGALSAVGTAADPITFTSNQASPAPGDWYYIRFYNTADDTTTVMEHCVVEYGGYSSGSLYAYQASPTFRNVTVQNSKTYGIYAYTAEPTIEDCTFSGNQNYDLYYTGTVGGSVTGSTINSGIYLLATGTVNFSGNTINQNNSLPIKAYADNVGEISASTFNNVDTASYLEVAGQTVSRDATWTAAIPYAVTGNTTVKGTNGADGITTLTIEPGVVVKLNNYRYIDIGASSGDPGALSAVGTAADPITFTSNQASPAPGDWYYIRFYNTADDATTVMEHCVVEYGGYSSGSLYAYQASPTFRNVTVQNSKTYGAYLYTAEPTIEDCTFSGNQNYDLYYTGTVGGSVTGTTINSGIYLLATGTVNFSGNTINQNNALPIKAYADNVGEISASTFNNVDTASYLEVAGQTVSRDATWTAAIPYVITNNITVKGTDGADGITTLTIEPGAIVKLNSYRYMDIGASSGDPGALIAQGTSDNQILFTSNQASPAPGDWYYIRFYNTADDATTVMDNCVVEYGGYSSGALYLYDAAPRIQNTTIRNSKTAGIYAYGTGTSAATINCNTFNGNQNGIYWTASPPPEMHNNNFIGNTNYGLNYSGSQTLDAEDCWWGDSAGPNQAGDQTNGNVDADPWSSAENQCVSQGANNPPNEPNTPTPADGAVRVDVVNGVDLQWSGGDPDILDTVVYDVYRGTSAETLAFLAQNIGTTTYQMTDAAQGQTYYWKIVAKDNRGLETSGAIWHFTADGEPPDLIVSSLTVDPAGNLQSGQQVTFTAQISNVGNGPVVDAFNVDFQINSSSIGSQPVDTIMLAGESVTVSSSWTYDGGDPTLEVMADSQSSVSETIENNNQYIALISEVADNTAPALAAHAPADGSHLQQVQQITITLTDGQSDVDDTAVIASFTVTDQSQQAVAGTTVEANDTFTFTPASLPLADGTYQVSVTAADTLGNQQPYQFSFIIDTQPPAKPVVTGATVASGTIQPRPAANQADDFMAPLEGTRDAGTSLWINGTQYLPAGSDTWSVDLTLQQGDNALEIWCVDQAGNQSDSEWVDIYVDPSNGLIFDYNDAGRMKRVRRIQ